MRSLRHPLTGALYDLQPDGLVRVEHEGRSGLFRPDGLGALARVFSQDTRNLEHVQRGLHASATGVVTLGLYQETKIRHFHQLLERWVSA